MSRNSRQKKTLRQTRRRRKKRTVNRRQSRKSRKSRESRGRYRTRVGRRRIQTSQNGGLEKLEKSTSQIFSPKNIRIAQKQVQKEKELKAENRMIAKNMISRRYIKGEIFYDKQFAKNSIFEDCQFPQGGKFNHCAFLNCLGQTCFFENGCFIVGGKMKVSDKRCSRSPDTVYLFYAKPRPFIYNPRN
jgi:hypothetical protein